MPIAMVAAAVLAIMGGIVAALGISNDVLDAEDEGHQDPRRVQPRQRLPRASRPADQLPAGSVFLTGEPGDAEGGAT